ncbi:MAG: hypothetical protein ACXVWU_08780 [Nocardioides sp.]
MAYLMLYGVGGWTQRWQIADDQDDKVRNEISRIGNEGTGHLPVVDPGTGASTTLVVSWSAIATGAVVDAKADARHDEETGRYA